MTDLIPSTDECLCGLCTGARIMDADTARQSSRPVIAPSGRAAWPPVRQIDGEHPGHVGCQDE